MSNVVQETVNVECLMARHLNVECRAAQRLNVEHHAANVECRKFSQLHTTSFPAYRILDTIENMGKHKKILHRCAS